MVTKIFGHGDMYVILSFAEGWIFFHVQVECELVVVGVQTFIFGRRVRGSVYHR